jgi:hypothetical protein
MTRIMQCCLLLAALSLCLFAGAAQAQDTSPMLAGFWSENYNYFTIVNPTTKPLTVYAIFYNVWDGYNGMECYKREYLPPNGTWYVGDIDGDTDGDFGTAKFFAFPAGTRKFDPNAVIGGFQVKEYGDGFDYHYYLESNLKAVTINTFTLREFSMIPPDNDKCFDDK